MSDNRKYYYLKLKENFFTTEKMVILESAQDGLLYSNLLLKMYLMSLKSGGILKLGDGLPHTPQTIATFTRHQTGTVERKKKERMRLKRQNLLPSGETDICPSNGRVDKCPPILEYRDKEIRDKSIENRE